jgi:hypothetical protein
MFPTWRRERHTFLVLLLLTASLAFIAVMAYGREMKTGTGPAPISGAFAERLTSRYGLGREDLVAIRGGGTVVRLLETSDPSELAILGVLRIDRPATVILDGLVRLDLAVRGNDRRAVVFSDPPVVADLDGLSLAPDVTERLADCKPGDCVMKLPRVDMARFRDTIDWRAADASGRANTLFRTMLHGYLQIYREGGGRALPLLDDKKGQVDLEAEFRGILDRSALAELSPVVAEQFATFPSPPPPDLDSVFFWTREKMGPRYVSSLRHCIAHRDTADVWHVAATRLIYANHFFRAELELAVVVPREDGGSYLLRVDRARIDPLAGVAKLGRGKVQDGAKESMSAELQSIRAVLSR